MDQASRGEELDRLEGGGYHLWGQSEDGEAPIGVGLASHGRTMTVEKGVVRLAEIRLICLLLFHSHVGVFYLPNGSHDHLNREKSLVVMVKPLVVIQACNQQVCAGFKYFFLFLFCS